MPAGVEDGNKLRVKGEGDAGAKGGPVGDLYVFLNVKGHPVFKRTGKDIFSERKVPKCFLFTKNMLIHCRQKCATSSDQLNITKNGPHAFPPPPPKYSINRGNFVRYGIDRKSGSIFTLGKS